MATADVTVRGAGIFGLAIAYVCLQRGARVQVIDPGGPGAGASGGVVGALAPHVPDNWNPKKAFQLDCLAGAKGRWAQVESVSGISPGYARTGRLQTLTDDRAAALARGRQAEAARNWGDRFVWEIIEAATVRAWAPQSPSGLLLRDSLSARIHPRRACESLAGAIRTLGGGVLPDATDEGIVIHATGWDGLVELNEALGVTVGGGVKGQAVLLRHVAPGGAPQIFAEGLHIIPHADGTVAVGSTSERDFDDPTSTDDQGDRLLETALARMPILHGATCIARWAGVRPRARSRAPILGAWPGRDSHFVANGGFKIGFGIAWGVADLMADLVLDGRNAIPEMFRIESNL